MPFLFVPIVAVVQPATPAIELSVTNFAETLRETKDKNALAESLRRWFGSDNLKKGAWPKEDNLSVVWAIEVAHEETGKPPRLISPDGKVNLPLQRVGTTDVWVVSHTFPEREAFRWAYEINGQRVGDWRDIELYTKPPELKRQPDVAQGKVTQMPEWRSTIFSGTKRDWWVYVPAQYTPDKPACVLVCQDGQWAKNEMPVVLDNLIAKGDIPPTIAVFIAPGTKDGGGSNRNFEYDTLSDAYARFLLEEMLPEVEKSYKLRSDAAGRVISGVSSGGICAFTVAWERPNAFQNVISAVGSFVNLQDGGRGIVGGHCYPAIIRKTKDNPKPIRVFLSDGENDLDNQFGNWPLANREMDKALTFARYEHKFVMGNGFHNNKFGLIQMPDALRFALGQR